MGGWVADVSALVAPTVTMSGRTFDAPLENRVALVVYEVDFSRYSQMALLDAGWQVVRQVPFAVAPDTQAS